MTQRVIDYAWNGPNPAAIAAAGFVGAVRYLSYSAGKNLAAGERDALRAHGLAIGLVWETTANRPTAGFAAGQADAVEANRQADALGVPDDVCIYFACDSDQTFAGVRDYYAGVKAASKRPPGCYGGSHVFEGLLKAGSIVYAWQSESTSFSDGVSPNAAIIQIFGRFKPDPGGDWDENHVLKPDWGQWAAPGQPNPRSGVVVADVGGVTPAPVPAPVPPTPKEIPPMRDCIIQDETNAAFLLTWADDGGPRLTYLDNPAIVSTMHDNGAAPGAYVASHAWVASMAEAGRVVNVALAQRAVAAQGKAW